MLQYYPGGDKVRYEYRYKYDDAGFPIERDVLHEDYIEIEEFKYKLN